MADADAACRCSACARSGCSLGAGWAGGCTPPASVLARAVAAIEPRDAIVSVPAGRQRPLSARRHQSRLRGGCRRAPGNGDAGFSGADGMVGRSRIRGAGTAAAGPWGNRRALSRKPWLVRFARLPGCRPRRRQQHRVCHPIHAEAALHPAGRGAGAWQFSGWLGCACPGGQEPAGRCSGGQLFRRQRRAGPEPPEQQLRAGQADRGGGGFRPHGTRPDAMALRRKRQLFLAGPVAPYGRRLQRRRRPG